METGQDLLAIGVVPVERLDNLELALYLLTAAAKVEGCASDKGKNRVALS